MASYSVFIKPSAAKELEAIPLKDRRRLVARIGKLASNPRPHGSERLSGLDRFRIRQGDYRVVYEIRDVQLVVLVVRVAHRREAYR
ncbi:MAG TPA: type II toxin-antitoxin system RelE/ParE family toxin [Verrucomicrobiae bacterium]|nr:type II toxin-antitoxin system RelE/ParE family toxin [Verrucomicrobiae bacterium]